MLLAVTIPTKFKGFAMSRCARSSCRKTPLTYEECLGAVHSDSEASVGAATKEKRANLCFISLVSKEEISSFEKSSANGEHLDETSQLNARDYCKRRRSSVNQFDTFLHSVMDEFASMQSQLISSSSFFNLSAAVDKGNNDAHCIGSATKSNSSIRANICMPRETQNPTHIKTQSNEIEAEQKVVRVDILLLFFVALPRNELTEECFTPTPHYGNLWIFTQPILTLPFAQLYFLKFRSTFWVGVASTAKTKQLRRSECLEWVRQRRSSHPPSIFLKSPSSPALNAPTSIESSPDSVQPISDCEAAYSRRYGASRYRQCSAVLSIMHGEVIGIAPCQISSRSKGDVEESPQAVYDGHEGNNTGHYLDPALDVQFCNFVGRWSNVGSYLGIDASAVIHASSAVKEWLYVLDPQNHLFCHSAKSESELAKSES